MWAQSQGHHTIDRQDERGVDTTCGHKANEKRGRERAIVNQTNIGTVSKVTLRETFERRSRAHNGLSRVLRSHCEPVPFIITFVLRKKEEEKRRDMYD